MHRFNEPIDDEFDKALLFLKQGKLIFDKSFKQALFEFFDKHYNDNYEIHDAIFENFSLFWNQGSTIPSLRLGEKVYQKVLEFTHEWEYNHQPHKMHKGTPYYFYAIFCILKGNLEKGLLLMHQAYLEDRRLGRHDTPASFFIRLDDSPQEQFFRPKVIETAKFLEKFLEEYRSIHNTNLTLGGLRNKFIGLSQFEDEAFYFVYCIFKLEKIIKTIEKEIRQNRVASYIETTQIFELCKLAEVLLEKSIQPGQNIKFAHRINCFCQDNRVNLSMRENGRTNNLGFLNREIDNDFANTIGGLLNRTYTHGNFVNNPTAIEYDIALTYVLRNFGGHRIEEQNYIYQEFEKISQAILNTIFYIIEKVY